MTRQEALLLQVGDLVYYTSPDGRSSKYPSGFYRVRKHWKFNKKEKDIVCAGENYVLVAVTFPDGNTLGMALNNRHLKKIAVNSRAVEVLFAK